ncbi:hypothetical protein [Victivallis sp. Marseille-Q1083]|uniref:hypothetical protein n=1 Tax=Victivallis sp. Marseille-Q1083 TaxID=2717288 RepID=UPI00158B7DFA|nr:hypothetical protein [Victivallis sp. Marseille-Q1083]
MSATIQVETLSRYELAEGKTLEKALRIVRSGILPNIRESDIEKGISMEYAKGIIWLAGCKDIDASGITPKQRARLKKLMERGFIAPMTDAELSKLTLHDAEILIEHGSSEYCRKQKRNDCSFNRKNHKSKE